MIILQTYSSRQRHVNMCAVIHRFLYTVNAYSYCFSGAQTTWPDAERWGYHATCSAAQHLTESERRLTMLPGRRQQRNKVCMCPQLSVANRSVVIRQTVTLRPLMLDADTWPVIYSKSTCIACWSRARRQRAAQTMNAAAGCCAAR